MTSKFHDSNSADESVFYQIVSKQFDSIWRNATTNQRTICIPPDDDMRYFYSCHSRDVNRVQLFIRTLIVVFCCFLSLSIEKSSFAKKLLCTKNMKKFWATQKIIRRKSHFTELAVLCRSVHDGEWQGTHRE